jgi:hypothetical protein
LLFLLQLTQALGCDGFGGVAAVGELAQRADLVVVATVQQITDRELADGTSTETIDLLVVRVLKGRKAELSLVAKVVPGPRSAIGILPRSFVGTTGVWFLKENSSNLDVLPLVQEFFEGRDLFVPVQITGQSPAPTGTLSQEVLAYQLRWYESLPYPTSTEDDLMFASLVHGQGQRYRGVEQLGDIEPSCPWNCSSDSTWVIRRNPEGRSRAEDALVHR